jgi:hypothetical protein
MLLARRFALLRGPGGHARPSHAAVKGFSLLPAPSERDAFRKLLLAVLALITAATPFLSLPSTARGQDVEEFEPSTWPSHDWRSPGYVSIVDGEMYDPDCWPIQSIGANVPNLMYRQSTIQNLDWMRQQKVRWIRVFVTGHREKHRITPDIAEKRLRELINLVEAYNKAVGPNEAIYLILTLTDYYGQGVPGDIYARDNPLGCEFVVLPAPWYRRGVQRFDFNPECGDEKVNWAPNYEVNYKPWVQRLVSSVAESPAILAWQLGNELKARKSPRNGAEDAYEWYLDFTADMVDTIRAADPNHLVMTGSQYFAELSDLPYRPGGKDLDPNLRDSYLREMDRMARACGKHCWNIWNLTYYDFHAYSLDDAMVLGRGDIASIATEFGFTLGAPSEQETRFGGDRVAALRFGVRRSWQDVFGVWHDEHWGLGEAMAKLNLAGAAAWGSPNPDVQTDPGSDLDRRRGISQAPEGMALWRAWSSVARDLETDHARSGRSDDCMDLNSSGRRQMVRSENRRPLSASAIARPGSSPDPLLEYSGTISGISTDFDEPTLVLKTLRREILIRMPKTQIVRTYNIGDRVKARGWPLSDDVMLATEVENLSAGS